MFSELDPTVYYCRKIFAPVLCSLLSHSLSASSSISNYLSLNTSGVEGRKLQVAKITLYTGYHLLNKISVSCPHCFCGTCQSKNTINLLQMSTNIFKF